MECSLGCLPVCRGRRSGLCRTPLQLAAPPGAQVADIFRLLYNHEENQVAARLAAALVDCGLVAVLTQAMIHLASQVRATMLGTHVRRLA